MNGEYILDLQKEREENADKIVVKPYVQSDVVTHSHRFFELVYITTGTTTHTLNGSMGIVGEGDYFIVDYGSSHSYTGSQGLTLINCLFLPESVDDTLTGCKSFESILQVCLIRYYRRCLGKTPANRVFHDGDGRVLNLLEGMVIEYRQKQVGFMEIFRGRLMEIFILTMRNIVKEEGEERRQAAHSTAVREAVEYIEANYRNKAVLSCFCEKHHYNLPYISRSFKRETGMTVLQYLQRIRIEKSCELLAGSELQVQEIAGEVGYEDIRFFHQVFKRLLQMSPGEYRKMAAVL